MKIDSHQHFWHYDPDQHVWMTEGMGSLKRDFLPPDLEPLLAHAGFDGTIAVQARQVIEETTWLLDLANRYSFIRGVVGWVDLCSREVGVSLSRLALHPKLVAVRHVVHDEPDDQFLRRTDFQAGLREVEKAGLAYDLLLFPRHLQVAVEVVRDFPGLTFVLDHIGKPDIRNGRYSPWEQDLRALSAHPNVFCKLSGMVTEAAWGQWSPEDFRRPLDVTFECFGPERLMIGSDWPVCTLSGSYPGVMEIVLGYLEQFPPKSRAGVTGENAFRIYQLDRNPAGRNKE